MSIQAKNTFGQLKESAYASDYIKNKRLRLLCPPKVTCPKGVRHAVNNGVYTINKRNLIVNLYSKEDLNAVKTVCTSNQTCETADPTTINTASLPFYQYYKIDPCGSLFGNSQCGVNNFVKYMVPDDVSL
jgi:hypothetical protein